MNKPEFMAWVRDHASLFNARVNVFLSQVDTIMLDEHIPTCGTGLEKGNLILFLGKLFMESNDETRAMLLTHESGHFLLGHLPRRGERDPLLWNLVADASLHYNKNCIHDEQFCVTFDKLQIPACPPEIAYELLKKKAKQAYDACSCGGQGKHGNKWDNSAASMVKQQAVRDNMNSVDPGASGAESGQPTYTPVNERAVPWWIRSVIDRLVVTTRRANERRRTWAREHRGLPELLPGQRAMYDRTALILIDASGSIPGDVLETFVSAVALTPELWSSKVLVFSHGCDDAPAEVSWKAVEDQLSRWSRGGTNYGPPAVLRNEEVPTVWLTDAEPGDSWPEPHEHELWIVSGNSIVPPGREVIRI